MTTSYWSDFVPNATFYRILSGFHRIFATGVACGQGTLTPPDTWSCPFWDLQFVLLVETSDTLNRLDIIPVCDIITGLDILLNLTFHQILVSIKHLQRVWHANRGRLLLRTPGPVPFGLAYVLLVETNPFPNLSLFYRTMLLEYPSVLSRFYYDVIDKLRRLSLSKSCPALCHKLIYEIAIFHSINGETCDKPLLSICCVLTLKYAQGKYVSNNHK